MSRYFRKNRPAQFLLIGFLLTVIGFIFQFFDSEYSRIIFYFAIFFLGFYATKEAVNETFTSKRPNVDLLMILAALGAVLINYESEGAMLLLIFAGAEVLEDYVNDKSTASITELMGQVPDTAELIINDHETKMVQTHQLQIGDRVLVAKGSNIPIDGILDRTAMINEAALTGESIPVTKEQGEEIFAGTVNVGNAFQLTVNKTSDQTVFSNIVRMVEEAQTRPSKVARFIDTFESKYVIGVLIAVPVFIFLLMAFANYSFQEAFYRGMVLLTVASPCALVASATPATLSAISNGATNGVLIKGGATLEALADTSVLFSDKTGTLTFGSFDVVDYVIEESTLPHVIYMEQHSNHPIAKAIIQKFKDVSPYKQTEDEVLEIPGKGMKMGHLTIGKPSAFDDYDDPNNYRQKIMAHLTTIFVGRNQEIVGYFALEDQIRPQAIEAVIQFKKAGVNVVMLTGDNEQVARLVSEQTNIDHYYAGLLPEDKINHIFEAQKANEEGIIAMIGDGINDSPALANSDIGIAMGSGSSIAMESADIVMVENNLQKLYYTFELSSKLNKIIRQNIIFAVGVIIVLIILNLLGWLDLPTGVIFHEGSTILVILNGLRLLGTKDK